MVSDACVVRLALLVSSVTGRYGTGLEWMIIGCEFFPATLRMRAITRPVIGEPSGFFATGTMTVSLFALGMVGPELSPCQPLERPMSPKARSIGTMVSRPERLGTS